MMGLEEFHLEGVDGKAKTWKEFGGGILVRFIRHNSIVREAKLR
jgi:hypothetical protein